MSLLACLGVVGDLSPWLVVVGVSSLGGGVSCVGVFFPPVFGIG